MAYKIFVINPGSTSTKLAYFENEHKIFETNVFHDAPDLAAFPTIQDQLPYRKQLILDFIRENHIDLTGVDAIVGRGGASYPCQGGVYEVSDIMLEDIVAARSGVQHPSNLGAPLGREIQKIYGGRLFIVDSPMTDEFQDVARITGLADLKRASHLHALNLKATIRYHCQKQGVRYEDGNYIVCHIDGGMSVTAHRHGRMIDGNDGAGGEGPFTPTRIGTVDVLDLIDYLQEKQPDLSAFRKQCMGSSGFVSHFGTSNSDLIHEKVVNGDSHARLIWDAMIYTICKQIGAMAVVLNGKVDGIVCGGGLLRFPEIESSIRERCNWIAPVSCYPGEFEHEAMAAGAIRILNGEEQLQIYSRPDEGTSSY